MIAGPPLPALAEGIPLHEIPNLNLFGVRWPEWARRERPLALLSPLNLWELGVSRFGVFPEMQTFALRLLLRWRALQARHRFDIVFDNQCLAWGLLGIRAAGTPVVSVIHHPLHIDREADFAIDPAFLEEGQAHALLSAPDATDRGAAARQDRDRQRGVAPGDRALLRDSREIDLGGLQRNRQRAVPPDSGHAQADRSALRRAHGGPQEGHRHPARGAGEAARARSRSRSSTAGFRTTGS